MKTIAQKEQSQVQLSELETIQKLLAEQFSDDLVVLQDTIGAILRVRRFFPLFGIASGCSPSNP